MQSISTSLAKSLLSSEKVYRTVGIWGSKDSPASRFAWLMELLRGKYKVDFATSAPDTKPFRRKGMTVEEVAADIRKTLALVCRDELSLTLRTLFDRFKREKEWERPGFAVLAAYTQIDPSDSFNRFSAKCRNTAETLLAMEK